MSDPFPPPVLTRQPSERNRAMTLARDYTDHAINRLAAALLDDDSRVAVTAAGMLLDRGWGKPTQEIAGQDGANLTFLHLIAARASSDALNNRTFDAEHTDVATDTNDTTNVDTAAKRNLMEPATE
ncbi:MAG TPA: hypothetical protein VGI53_07405 [Dyella sp.]